MVKVTAAWVYLSIKEPTTHSLCNPTYYPASKQRPNPLLSEDNSNFNTPNKNAVTLSIPVHMVNVNPREQLYSSQMRQVLQRHKLSSGKL